MMNAIIPASGKMTSPKLGPVRVAEVPDISGKWLTKGDAAIVAIAASISLSR